MADQFIKCSVDTCKYNSEESKCALHDIQVGCGNFEAHKKGDTECASFEMK